MRMVKMVKNATNEEKDETESVNVI